MIVDFHKTADKYHRITRALIGEEKTVAAMESCTGGLVGVLLSDIDGASAVVPGGTFSYSNEEKIRNGVPETVINRYGVYSAETARHMASAAREGHSSDIGIGITGSIGVADPNNPDSVPGEVYIAMDVKGEMIIDRMLILPLEIIDEGRMSARYYVADKVADMMLTVVD